MDDPRKDLQLSIERRIQFVITLIIFYATFSLNFFKFAGGAEVDGQKFFLQIGGYTTLYIFSYILFQILKSKLKEKWLRHINMSLLVAPLSLIYPVLMFAQLKITIDPWDQILFYGSMYVFILSGFITTICIAIPGLGSLYKLD